MQKYKIFMQLKYFKRFSYINCVDSAKVSCTLIEHTSSINKYIILSLKCQESNSISKITVDSQQYYFFKVYIFQKFFKIPQ